MRAQTQVRGSEARATAPASGGRLRSARDTDYLTCKPLYARVHPFEPLLSPDLFRALLPQLCVADSDEGVVGFLRVHRGPTARVSMLAVATRAEGRGLARSMMQSLAAQLRAEGAKSWSLSVKRANERALGLYGSLGLREVSSTTYWHCERPMLTRLPAPGVPPRTRCLDASEYRKTERALRLRPQQLADHERLGAEIVIAERGGRPLGVASLQHGSGPLIFVNARSLESIRPLLSVLWPSDPALAVCSSSRLVCDAVKAAGAQRLFETVELQGLLSQAWPPPVISRSTPPA